MTRVKRGTTAHKRRKALLKKTKGYQWGRKSKYRLAKQATIRAGQHQYRHRREKKRDTRRAWQVSISAAVKEHGLSYSVFMNALKKKGIELDRKVLSELAKTYPQAFTSLVKSVAKEKKSQEK